MNIFLIDNEIRFWVNIFVKKVNILFFKVVRMCVFCNRFNKYLNRSMIVVFFFVVFNIGGDGIFKVFFVVL